jgi:hypothetical protein
MDATAEQPVTATVSDSTRSTQELFKFSTWVHVGLGAEDCEEGDTGACGNPLHFHAWCRLPNQFQHSDIRERALAAKARRMRQLRDPGTDAYEILEADIADLERAGDTAAAVDELIGKDWWKRQLEAMGYVEERDEFKTIEKDRERMVELRAMPAEQRPADEMAELERHLHAYAEAVEAERAKLEQPIRDGLEAAELAELIHQVREDRIAAEGSQAFMETYSKWEWLAGTFTSDHPVERRRRFEDVAQLEQAAPEVIDALRTVFGEMETSLQRGPRGN